MSKVILILLAVLAVQASSTTVKRCDNSADDSDSVTISGCDASPCTVKKGTKVQINIKFSTTSTVEDLRNHVTAKVFGANAPFPGVDGTSACSQVYHEDDSPAPCPLQAGGQYIYKGGFEVSRAYPSLTTRVHYALRSKSQDVACFEATVQITN